MLVHTLHNLPEDTSLLLFYEISHYLKLGQLASIIKWGEANNIFITEAQAAECDGPKISPSHHFDKSLANTFIAHWNILNQHHGIRCRLSRVFRAIMRFVRDDPMPSGNERLCPPPTALLKDKTLTAVGLALCLHPNVIGCRRRPFACTAVLTASC